MSDEITLDGEIFVSSKRASDLSGYEQDYIGQLCRGANIRARRVGGLWYVSADSLIKYKERADGYKPEPPAPNTDIGKPDALLSFEGKGYISTSRASKVTGYSPDYVGQMARAGIIPSRQVGNRWYVEQAGILKHKESKDALLGAVQVESVGLKTPEAKEEARDYRASPLLRYTGDERELLPSMGESADFVARPADVYPIGPEMGHNDEGLKYTREETHEEDEEEFVIPIRVRHGEVEKIRKIPIHIPLALVPRRSMLPVALATSLFTIVIVLSLGFVSLKKSSVYTTNENKGGGTSRLKANQQISWPGRSMSSSSAQLASAGIIFIDRAGDILEEWFVPELVYRRAE